MSTTAESRPLPRRPGPRDPERTRHFILQAAQDEFAAAGFDGARVNAIAERAGANKRMIYHYFGDKRGLYRAVLEAVYAAKRAEERGLDLDHLDPAAAITALVEFNFAYTDAHPEFIRLLNDENLHGAAHVRDSLAVRELYSPLVDLLARTLARGQAAGVFRGGIDPVQLYVTIAGLAFFYFSNNGTLSAIFDRDLRTAQARRVRREHDVELVLHALRAG